MESYGRPGSITLSARAWNAVARYCRGTPLGMVEIKGKGSMEMFQLSELRGDIPPPDLVAASARMTVECLATDS